MTTRHLLPDEIDQLLDGEVGFGIAPLEAHVRECAECRAELEAGRRVVDAIEHLPRLAPTPLFTDQVMARVTVYEPWEVAMRDAADRWVSRLVPRSRPLRVVAGAAGITLAAALSVVCVWLGAHLDAVFFFGSMARSRLRAALVEGVGGVIATVFGPQSVDAIRTAGPGLVLGMLATMVVLLLAAGLVVRTAVSSARRGRA